MAPEVLDGAIQFTRDAFLRIDVYALGLVIWELMTRAHRSSDPPLPNDEEVIPRLSPYMAPFEAELGPNPTMDKLQHYVAKLRNRPQPCPWWVNDQVSGLANSHFDNPFTRYCAFDINVFFKIIKMVYFGRVRIHGPHLNLFVRIQIVFWIESERQYSEASKSFILIF